MPLHEIHSCLNSRAMNCALGVNFKTTTNLKECLSPSCRDAVFSWSRVLWTDRIRPFITRIHTNNSYLPNIVVNTTRFHVYSLSAINKEVVKNIRSLVHTEVAPWATIPGHCQLGAKKPHLLTLIQLPACCPTLLAPTVELCGCVRLSWFPPMPLKGEL